MSPTIISPTINISNIDQCGLDVDVFNAAYEEANCSILVGNPCIYTVRVGMVYKGSHTVREKVTVDRCIILLLIDRDSNSSAGT